MTKSNYQPVQQDKIRNIAIIAHVDHGKTTLVDAFIKQAHLFRENQKEMEQQQILDSGDLEREKGITIKAKNIAIRYNDYKINIIDTPGHSDFGGEVERTLNMADGCLLLVDAQEGPMPQTKFVLKKALELKLRPIVVINKIDKKFAQPQKVIQRIEDLFLTLATDDDQLDFPILYAIARDGLVFEQLPDLSPNNLAQLKGDLRPLLDKIIELIPAPKGSHTEPLQMQINSLDFDPHVGRFLIGKIARGTIKKGQNVVVLPPEDKEDQSKKTGTVEKILVREGLEFVEVDSASAGEIISVGGIESDDIGGTMTDSAKQEPLPTIKLSPPAVKIKFEANTSPFVGKDGKFVTIKLLQQRLEQEKVMNIGLTITKAEDSGYFVAGRGELQLAILIETLRREGYEFQVRKPEVILKEEDGVIMEPIEELIIDTQEEYVGAITQALSKRNGELLNLETENTQSRLTYKILTRNLLGLRNMLLTATKGNVVMNNFMLGYVPFSNQQELFRRGVLIASDTGVSKGYALNTIQERGDLFIEPGVDVYEGMIVGINKYPEDMEVNAAKERHKSSVRKNSASTTVTLLKAPTQLTLEFALSFLAKDEILEVTPLHLRLRKAHLTKNERDFAKRKSLNAQAAMQNK